jgi:hypothetical protein
LLYWNALPPLWTCLADLGSPSITGVRILWTAVQFCMSTRKSFRTTNPTWGLNPKPSSTLAALASCRLPRGPRPTLQVHWILPKEARVDARRSRLSLIGGAVLCASDARSAALCGGSAWRSGIVLTGPFRGSERFRGSLRFGDSGTWGGGTFRAGFSSARLRRGSFRGSGVAARRLGARPWHRRF